MNKFFPKQQDRDHTAASPGSKLRQRNWISSFALQGTYMLNDKMKFQSRKFLPVHRRPLKFVNTKIFWSCYSEKYVVSHEFRFEEHCALYVKTTRQ